MALILMKILVLLTHDYHCWKLGGHLQSSLSREKGRGSSSSTMASSLASKAPITYSLDGEFFITHIANRSRIFSGDNVRPWALSPGCSMKVEQLLDQEVSKNSGFSQFPCSCPVWEHGRMAVPSEKGAVTLSATCKQAGTLMQMLVGRFKR